MTVNAQKYLVALLSLLLLGALVVAGTVDARRRAAQQAGQTQAAGPLDPQLDRGREIYEKYSCIACHGPGGAGGVHNANAQTGGMINGLRFVGETYTKSDLAKKILDGVPVVPKADANGPNPPLAMPAYRGLIGYQETQDLVEYLFSLKPPGTKKAKADQW